MKTLVVYYSRSGNTKTVAEYIAKIKKADIFEVRQKKPYSEDYKTCVKEVLADYNNQTRPEFVDDIDIKNYDDIYVGYPNYCGDMPMVLYTFLEHHDFGGKTIHAFCTHGGSGLAGSIEGIMKSCPDSIIAKPLALKTSGSIDLEIVNEWLQA